jgi:hypothetical protein
MLLAVSSLLCDTSGAFTESGTFRLDSHKAGMLTASGAYGGPAFLTV